MVVFMIMKFRIAQWLEHQLVKLVVLGSNPNMETILKYYETFILTKYNDIEDITQCIHTVCITKKNGKFYVHNNSYYGHNIQYDSIEDILNRIDGGLAKDIVLLGIRKK